MDNNVIRPDQSTPVIEPSNLAVPAAGAVGQASAPQPVTAPLVSADFEQQTAYPTSPPAAAKSFRKPLKALVAVALVAVVFVGGFLANSGIASASQNNASKQAKAFVAALNKGDNSAAYALGSANLRGQETEAQFATSMGDLKASSPTRTEESISFNGRNSTYNVTEDGLPKTDDDSTSGTFTVALVKDGLTGWKVDNVSVD